MLQSKEQIGKLDRRITFQREIFATNESNEDEGIGWQDEVEVWAGVDDKPGNEVYQSEQLVAVRSSVFTIRYRDVNTSWRISFDGSYYDIISIQRPDRKGYLKVIASIGKHYQETVT